MDTNESYWNREDYLSKVARRFQNEGLCSPRERQKRETEIANIDDLRARGSESSQPLLPPE